MRKIKRLVLSFLLMGAFSITVFAQNNNTYFMHTIEKGQSLYSIASMYGVPQAEIIRLNPGCDVKIIAGQQLRIPSQKGNSKDGIFHTISAGETLYRLTKIYNVSAKDICDANPGLSADNFKTGQVILIPVNRAKVQGNVPVKAGNNPVGIQPAVVSRCREMYRVEKRMSISKLCKMFNVTERDLIELNPELKGASKVNKNDFICIPYSKEKTPKEAATPVSEPTGNSEIFVRNESSPIKYNNIKAAVILPFYDGVPKGDAERMVEYYQGVLMAVDSLKKAGTSIDLYAYNSGSHLTSIDPILMNSELKEMNVIFGPLYQEHIQPLQKFAEQNKVRLVIPFTSKDNSVFKNPNIFQINTPQSYLYSEVYDHFMRQFPNANVIFIQSQEGKDKQEFIKGMKEELARKGIPMKTVSDLSTAEDYLRATQTGKQNIFIPTSGKSIVLTKIIPQLAITYKDNPEVEMHLFGYPEWQTYTNEFLDSFFAMDTYFYSSFYTNNLLPSAVNFSHNFTKWYGKVMDERYPKFGMLGFDTAYFFLKGLASYGNKFEKDMGNMDIIPIQTGFKFERVNNWGGFINRKVFFVHFTPDFQLVKLNFDN